MSDIQVTIGAELDGLHQGLDDASEMTEKAVKGMERGHRAAHLLAEGIQEIGGVSKLAGTAIGDMLAGFATGGVMGLAFGAVNALVHGLKSIHEEAAKEVRFEIKGLEDSLASAKKMEVEIEKINFIKAGGTAAQWEAQHNSEAMEVELQKKRQEREEEYQKLNKRGRLEEMEAQVAMARTTEAAGSLKLESMERMLAAARTPLDKLDVQIHDLENRLATLKAGAALIDAEKAKDKDKPEKTKVDKGPEQEALAAYLAGRAMLEQRKKDLAEMTEAIRAENEARSKAEEKEQKDDFKRAETLEKDKVKLYKEVWEAEQKGRLEAGKLAVETEKKNVQELVRDLQPLRHAADQLFQGMLQGGQSMSRLLHNTFKTLTAGILSDLSTMGTKWAAEQLAQLIEAKVNNASTIASLVPVGAAGAFASQASIPIVGPELAIAAAADATGFLSSLIPLASAGGGWDVPWTVGSHLGGGGAPTMLEGGEKVLDRSRNAKLDNFLDSGGGGGVTHVHNWNVQTPDAASFYRMLKSNRRGFEQAVTELRGLGSPV